MCNLLYFLPADVNLGLFYVSLYLCVSLKHRGSETGKLMLFKIVDLNETDTYRFSDSDYSMKL